jgi:hypothetical protein
MEVSETNKPFNSSQKVEMSLYRSSVHNTEEILQFVAVFVCPNGDSIRLDFGFTANANSVVSALNHSFNPLPKSSTVSSHNRDEI